MVTTKKLIRNIVILVVVIAAVVGALLFAIKYDPDKDEGLTSNSISLFKTDSDSITKLSIKTPDESYVLVKQEENWIVEGQPDVRLNNAKVQTLLSDNSSVSADQVIEEAPADLSIYGLDAPQYTVTIEVAEGEGATLVFGDDSGGKTVRYTQREGDPAVYTTYYSKATAMCPALSALRDLQIYNMSEDAVRGVTVRRVGKPDIVLEAQMTTDQDGNEVLGGWQMTQPYERTADPQKVSEQLTTAMSGLSAKEVVEDNAADLSKYGLDAPRGSITFVDKDGVVTTLVVGAKYEEADSEYTYVMCEGNPAVYSVAESNASFLSLEPEKIMDRFIHLQNIGEVDSVTVAGRGTSYVMTITGEEDNETYAINGKEIVDSTFKGAYQAVIGILLDAPTDARPTQEPEYTVTYKLKDGSTVEVEYISIADRDYIALVNGEGEFAVKKKDVVAMFDSVEKAYNS